MLPHRELTYSCERSLPGASAGEQGGLDGEQELTGDLGGLGVRGATAGLRIGGGEVGSEGDAVDVLHTGPAQPVLEVRLLEVVAEAGPPVRAVDGAGVDDRHPL